MNGTSRQGWRSWKLILTDFLFNMEIVKFLYSASEYLIKKKIRYFCILSLSSHLVQSGQEWKCINITQRSKPPSLLLFTSPSLSLPSASIPGNTSLLTAVTVCVCVWPCVRASLVEVSTGCRHPNRNLIQRCMMLFLNRRLCATCFSDIYESCCLSPPYI